MDPLHQLERVSRADWLRHSRPAAGIKKEKHIKAGISCAHHTTSAVFLVFFTRAAVVRRTYCVHTKWKYLKEKYAAVVRPSSSSPATFHVFL